MGKASPGGDSVGRVSWPGSPTRSSETPVSSERGRAWECVVSDGERHAHVRAEAPDLGAGQAILPELVETAIERRAEDAGFDGVVAQAPIVLGPAELTTA